MVFMTSSHAFQVSDAREDCLLQAHQYQETHAPYIPCICIKRDVLPFLKPNQQPSW